jgi:hypothetical protein
MTVAEAEKQLLGALATGNLVAVAKDARGNVVDIPQREWPYLHLFEEQERDVLKHDALDREAAFTDVKLERDALQKIWVEFLVEPYMIEPMTRPGTAGYVPLCSALHWVMTIGGSATKHLEDVEAWTGSIERLLPLISTGEIEVLGRPNSSGLAEPIRSHVFAGILVSHPLRDSFSILVGDDPWISCTPYVDEQHWKADFNDQLFLFRSRPATWTHLQVKKSDVLREIKFEGKEPAVKAVYDSGTPGRPTSMHLVRMEFEARYNRGQTAQSITLEADALAEWLRKAHPDAPPLKPKTIRNQLAEAFRGRLRGAQK